MSRRKWFAAAALAVAIACACTAVPARAQVVDFESYPEGVLDFSFTDAPTGVFFSDARRQGDVVRFVIEDGGPPPGSPQWFPGMSLVGGGYAPGPSASRPANFSFAARFPYAVRSASLDVNASLISSPGSVTLEGLDTTGAVVATSTMPVTSFVGQTFTMSLDTTSDVIRSIRLVPNNVFDAADNLAFVPEPATAMIAVVAAAPLLARRRRRRRRRSG